MRLPIRIERNSLLEAFVARSTFEKARDLQRAEDFTGSNEILFQDLQRQHRPVPRDCVSSDELWALVAHNLFALKDFQAFEDLISELGVYNPHELPRLFLVTHYTNRFLGKADEALAFCEEFIRSNSNPIDSQVADFLSLKGYIEYRAGETDKAIRDLEISYSLFDLQGKDFERAISANWLGMVYRLVSNFWNSEMWLNRALEAFDHLKLSRKKSMTLLNLGVTHYKSGNLQKSHATLLESHKIGVEGDWPHRQVFTNIALGNVLRMQLDRESARQHLHTAYGQAQELGYPREEALALEFLGDVYRDEGQFDQAQRFYQRAMALGLAIAPVGDIVMECHRRLGECQAARGEFGEAVQSLQKCLLLARRQGDRYEEAVALRVHGQIKMDAGSLEKADQFFGESVAILDEIGARYELAVSLKAQTELKLRQADRGDNLVPQKIILSQAWSHATKALDHAIFTGVASLIEDVRALSERISRMRNGLEMARRDRGPRRVRTPRHVIIHQSPMMRDLLELTDMFAVTEEPVLITGETGTGKELIARRLHRHSRRAEGKLVSVNVTAIPATMFEREMFGHVKGSFSGAEQDGKGFVGEAAGGTLFLDEIGDLPAEMQPKLLRLLQEGTYQALGDPGERQADIRIIAATNASLKEKVDSGEFRSDLYFRLKVLGLDLPPLRERVGDVPLLMNHFLSEAAGQPMDMSSYFDQDSIDFLSRHAWPGNVRELAVLAKRAHVERQTRGNVRIPLEQPDGSAFILKSPEALLARIAAAGDLTSGRAATDQAATGRASTVREVEISERARIQMALDQCGGNRVDAARRLGMGRSTLYRKMKKYGL